MKKVLLFSNPNLPLMIQQVTEKNISSTLNYFRDARLEIEELLQKHGAVLFRGFAITNSSEFERCVIELGGSPFGYQGGNSPRRAVSGNVFTSTEYPSTETISLHNEMSYLPTGPSKLYFFCEQPAQVGGQTTLASNREILNILPDDLVREFEERRVKYVRYFQKQKNLGKSWQETYNTESIEELEKILENQCAKLERFDDGTLIVSNIQDAVRISPDTKTKVWFNQAEQWHPSALKYEIRNFLESNNLLMHNCYFGDGGNLNEKSLSQIREALLSNKLTFRWEKSDLLIVDNLKMMHGRESFTGPRRVLTYLSI